MGNLFERIKQTIQKFKPALAPIGEPTVAEEPEEVALEPIKRIGYLTEATMIHAIRESAKHRRLVYILYNNLWRYVEPYSFRQGKYGTLFYGHDLARNNTRSYYVHRIQELNRTDIPYSARWFVEIG